MNGHAGGGHAVVGDGANPQGVTEFHDSLEVFPVLVHGHKAHLNRHTRLDQVVGRPDGVVETIGPFERVVTVSIGREQGQLYRANAGLLEAVDRVLCDMASVGDDLHGGDELTGVFDDRQRVLSEQGLTAGDGNVVRSALADHLVHHGQVVFRAQLAGRIASLWIVLFRPPHVVAVPTRVVTTGRQFQIQARHLVFVAGLKNTH